MSVTTRGSSSWRIKEWGTQCNHLVLVTDYWMIGVGKITCHKGALSAFRALGRVFHSHGYNVRSDYTGAYNCRPITGGTVPSAHAQGIALDVNWDTNPYTVTKLITDFPEDIVEAVHALKTPDGVQVFQWGGQWGWRPDVHHSNYDAMHWEVIATPAELVGAFKVREADPTDKYTWPLLGEGERGPAVAQLQTLLAEIVGPGIFGKVDGFFGPKTYAAVRQYQTTRKLMVDGVVGFGTWTALFHAAPPTTVDPTKGQAII
jgi:hypothetical protein